MVEGRLTNLFVGFEHYKGLADAVILEKVEALTNLETMPSFNGGDTMEFTIWVNSQLNYPKVAKENGVQGRVTLSFTVEKDGSVTEVKVLKGVDPSLDKEAVRVVSKSPKWTPARRPGMRDVSFDSAPKQDARPYFQDVGHADTLIRQIPRSEKPLLRKI